MTQRKNVLQKFGSFYNRLSPQEQSDLMTLMSAYRGPDVDYGYLRATKDPKSLTTAKIRAMIFKYCTIKIDFSGDKTFVDSLDGSPEINQTPITKEDLEYMDKFTPRLGGHFRSHISRAVDVIKSLNEL